MKDDGLPGAERTNYGHEDGVVRRPGGEIEPRDSDWAPARNDHRLPDRILPPTGGGSADNGQRPLRRRPVVWLSLSLFMALVVIVSLSVALLKSSGNAQAKATTSATPSPTTAIPTTSEPVTTEPATPATTTDNPGASPTDSVSAAPVATPTASPASPAADSGGPVVAQSANLSDLNAVSASNIGVSSGSAEIGSTAYTNSVLLNCSSGNVAYNVAGYNFLNATIGIPSNSSYAIGRTATITFYKDGNQQLGKPFSVTLGHPQAAHVALQGAAQLEIACNGMDTQTKSSRGVDVALGSAALGQS